VSDLDRGGHPAPEELDVLVEGGTPPPELGSHVQGCAECSALVAGMTRVRELLRAEAEHVPPAPADLEERIQAALAEASAQDVGSAPEELAAGGTVVPLPPRPRVPRWLAAVAGLVVLGGAATAATQLVGQGGADSSVAGAAHPSAADSSEGGVRAAEAASAVVATGTDYAPATLGGQVQALLEHGPTSGGVVRLNSENSDNTDAAAPRLRTPEGLAGCLSAIGAAGQVPRVVDLATWQGRDVAVIVLQSQPDRAEVWVVDRSCRPGADGLVYYQSVPM
jgi:hypothetical protein